MKKIFLFINLLLFNLCFSQVSFEEYKSYHIVFDKKKLTSPNNDFTITIPSDWNSEYVNFPEPVNEKHLPDDYHVCFSESRVQDNYVLCIYESNEDGFHNTIYISKDTIRHGNLENQYEISLENTINSPHVFVTESGKTRLLRKSFFIHSISESEVFGKCEMIRFLVPSTSKTEFYYITAIVDEKNDFVRMSKMIECIETFKEISKK